MFKVLKFLLVLPLASCWCGCAPAVEREWTPRGQAIFNGDLDDRPEHQAVVALSSGYSFCSGTLITPRVVLTAAHCADASGPEAYTVTFGAYMDSGISRGVAEVLVHPDYDDGGDALPPVNDLSLMLLDAPAPPGVTPIPRLPSYLAVSAGDIGQPLEFVGFGETEDGTSGVRMTVVNNLSWICTEASGCAIGPARAVNNSICQDQRPGGPCSGDSGGPALILRGGEEYVAGVTSYGDEDCIRFGCSTKADAFDAWIGAFAAGRLGAECGADGDCRSGFCAGGLCCDRACSDPCQTCAKPGFVGTCVPLADGIDCGDDDVCNGQEQCLAGSCQTGQPLDCDDGNPCTVEVCNAFSGCLSEDLPDGQACAPVDVCAGSATCQSGRCVPRQALDCDDGDPCTVDGCDPEEGCHSEALADGAACGSGLCGAALCVDGVCVASDPPDCDDGNVCTQDRCDPQLGCLHSQTADGTACGPCRMCVNSACVSEPECGSGSGCACSAANGDSGLSIAILAALLGLIGWRRR